MVTQSIIIFVLSFIFIVIIILLTRELWCWYFKINDIIAVLKQIRDGNKVPSSQKITESIEPISVEQQTKNKHIYVAFIIVIFLLLILVVFINFFKQ
jgi:hypothetical protein